MFCCFLVFPGERGGTILSEMFFGWGAGVTRVSGFRVRSAGLSGFEVQGFGLRVSGIKVQGSLFFFFFRASRASECAMFRFGAEGVCLKALRV